MTSQRTFSKKLLAAAISTATTLTATAALAQTNTLEEVLVTATAREQSMQDIPYNISAMSGDDMEAQLITDQAELLRAMSGVSVVDRGYRNSGTVNSIIIRGLNVDNGLNGFLCNTEEEWENALRSLIESPELRTEMGVAGRETVVNRYSVSSNTSNFLSLFT